MKQATKLNQIILLIQSLSKAEKRYIRLYTNLQNFSYICSAEKPSQARSYKTI